MDNKEFRQKLQQYVKITPDHPATEIQSWHPQVCSDCERTITEPLTRRATRLRASGWREYCLNCKCYRNPDSGEFDIKHGFTPKDEKRRYQAMLKRQARRQSDQPANDPKTTTWYHLAEKNLIPASAQDYRPKCIFHRRNMGSWWSDWRYRRQPNCRQR